MSTNNITLSDLGSDETINNYRFLHINIVQFSPMNWTLDPDHRGVPISATLELSNAPDGADTAINVVLDGNSLTVTFPAGGPHRDFNFGFCLNGSDYILSGIRFVPDSGCSASTLGPVLTNRNEDWTTLTVTDRLYQNSSVVTFKYVLLVKKKDTGEIGIIGPIAVTNKIY